MKKIHFTFFTLACILFNLYNASAQHYYNQTPEYLKANSNWILGDYGVNMNTDPPSVFPVPYYGIDTDAVYYYGIENTGLAHAWFYYSDGQNDYGINVSDPNTGQLLFVSKNHNCYDRNFNLMPHGFDAIEDWQEFTLTNDFVYLRDKVSSIVPFPNNPKRYYYFSSPLIDSRPNYNSVRYSVIDMNLNNGLGDVDASMKDIILWQSQAESVLSLVPIPGNNCDLWFILFVSNINDSNVKAITYHIDGSGLNPNPVAVYESPVADLSVIYGNTTVKGKVSPDRKQILFYNHVNQISKFSFDAETGIVNGFKILNVDFDGTPKYDYSLDFDFTPDSRYLICARFENHTIPPKINSTITFYKLSDSNAVYSNQYVSPGHNPISNGISTSLSLKSYNNRLYFNKPKDTVYLPSITAPYHSLFGTYKNTGLSNIINKPDVPWNESQYNLIDLPPFCVDNFPSEIVYPFKPSDTIPNVYMDTIVCGENSIHINPFMLKAKPGFSDYTWNDGTIGSDKLITDTGRYWVYYQGPCNFRVDSFIVYANNPVNNIVPADTTICEQRFPFKLTALDVNRYLWFDNSESSSVTIENPGVYWLQSESNGCIRTDSIHINAQYCPCHVSVPTVFTPNGDDLNDYFKPSIALGCVPSEYSLRIFNRWGQMVYSSFNEFDRGWNGFYKNGDAEVGTYFYELKFKSRFLNEPYYKRGDFVLVR
ncbi:gliding motility-associated C-terminal domain-containing protein [Taibaiella lutea]|uniref:Gliding motility-associated C-terminal domain-containing protein n=1 Tax=Taibaiella lutea TaxID=2608001 RepID=A0A5M6CGZ4_9BACT|nr:gliding motility-associated C-terminal domain-containing protein [Taibaiella lutea]KAA5532389.1 gliding motility-associated C-terminal domain-containing protein [Taibaiella lutea]